MTIFFTIFIFLLYGYLVVLFINFVRGYRNPLYYCLFVYMYLQIAVFSMGVPLTTNLILDIIIIDLYFIFLFVVIVTLKYNGWTNFTGYLRSTMKNHQYKPLNLVTLNLIHWLFLNRASLFIKLGHLDCNSPFSCCSPLTFRYRKYEGYLVAFVILGLNFLKECFKKFYIIILLGLAFFYPFPMAFFYRMCFRLKPR